MIIITDNIDAICSRSIKVKFNNNYGDISFVRNDNQMLIEFGMDFSKEYDFLLIDRINLVIDYCKDECINEITIDLGDIRDNVFMIIDSLTEIFNDYLDRFDVTIYSKNLKDTDDNIINLFENNNKIEVLNTGYIEEKFEKFRDGLKKDLDFRDYLNNLMYEKDLKPSKVYIPAQVSCPLFSNIISYKYNPPYHPSKGTVASIGIALKLNEDEMQELYNHAGYYLTKSEFQDIVIRFFIKEKIYDTYQINSLLFNYDEKCLIDKKSSTNSRVRVKSL